MGDKSNYHHKNYYSGSCGSSRSSRCSRSRSRDRYQGSQQSYNKKRQFNQSRPKSRYHSQSRSPSLDRLDSHERSLNKRNYKDSSSHFNGIERSQSRSPNRHSRTNIKNRYLKHASINSQQSSSKQSSIILNAESNVDTKKTIDNEVADKCNEDLNGKPDAVSVQSVFKNDGSFLEMFKKMQEQNTSNAAITLKQSAPVIVRRRGGKVLKTGIVEKAKAEEENEGNNKSTDPWAIYINEVKKYRQTSCQDEAKTRSLVK